MAQFDASGCPSEFLSIVRKLQADIQNKQNLILKEKQLIEGAESQIEEKTKATKLLQEKNAELERSIQHLNTLGISQTKQMKSLKDGGELLKEQARNKAELFEILKEKNDRIKGDCEAKYQEFREKFLGRMNYYETLPLVPEYKHQLERNIELHKQLEIKRSEITALQDKIKHQEAEQEASNPHLRFTEWGVTFAKLMQRVMKIDSASSKKSLLSLQGEIEELESKKDDIQKMQSKLRNSLDHQLRNEADTRKKYTSSSQAEPTLSSTTCLPKLPSLATTFKPSSVPDFRSFFKSRNVVRNQHVPGSSGSSLLSSSVPNIPSALFNAKSDQLPAAGNVQKSFPPNSKGSNFPSGKNLPTESVPSTDISDTNLRRSLSLTALLPQVKPMKKIDTPMKSSLKNVRSLADWLKPPTKNLDQISGNHKLPQIVENRADMEESKKNTEERAIKSKNEKTSPPLSALQPHVARMTEVPLLRQVQEKILHEKIVKDQEPQELTVCDNDPSSVMEVEERQEKTNNMLKMFDGPIYDVPMTEQVEENEEIGMQRPQKSQSPTSGVPHYSVEDHQRMMAELQKSPEDSFRFQSNVVPTDGGENSYLISPTRSDNSPEQNSPESIGCRVSSGNDFQFAVPTHPPPSRHKHPWSSTLDSFSFNIGHNESKSQKEEEESSSSPFGGFNFAGEGDASQGSSAGFSFDIGQSKSPGNESSSFSFVFGGSGDGAKSPPDTSASMFTFGSESPTSPDEKQSSFFSSVDERDKSETSSFASIFGCKK